MNNKIANIIATYFGLGLSKYAPGTVGSLGTLPLAYVLIYFGGVYALLLACVILFFVGVRATDIVIKESGNEDPSKVVIDEVVGQLLTFSFINYSPTLKVSSLQLLKLHISLNLMDLVNYKLHLV